MPTRLAFALLGLAAALAVPAAASTCGNPDPSIDLEQRAADCEADLGRVWDRSGAAHLVFNQGSALRLLGRTDEALPLLHEALRYNPERGLYWAELARLYLALGEPGTAAAMFSQAMAQEPNDPYAQADRAEAWFHLGRAQSCLTDLDATLPRLKGQQDEAWFLNLHGRCLEAAGQHAQAVAAFDAALAVMPGYVDALGNRIASLFAAGNYQAVLDSSAQLLDRAAFPDLEQGWEIALRGQRIESLAFLARPATEAAAEVQLLKSRYPGVTDVTKLEVWQLYLAGDFQAADTASAPLREGEQPGFVFDTLAQLDLALGRKDQALRGFETAAWLDPSIAKTWVRPLTAQGYLPQTRLADDILRSVRRCIEERGAECSLRPLPVTEATVVTVRRPDAPPPSGPTAPEPADPVFEPDPTPDPAGAADPGPQPPGLGRPPSPVRPAP